MKINYPLSVHTDRHFLILLSASVLQLGSILRKDSNSLHHLNRLDPLKGNHRADLSSSYHPCYLVGLWKGRGFLIEASWAFVLRRSHSRLLASLLALVCQFLATQISSW